MKHPLPHADHMRGKMGLIRMLECQQRAEPRDLARYRRHDPLAGDLYVGEIFEWEPDKPWAAEPCQILQITDDEVLTRGLTGDYWNDMSRFREAAVRSLLKTLPGS